MTNRESADSSPQTQNALLAWRARAARFENSRAAIVVVLVVLVVACVLAYRGLRVDTSTVEPLWVALLALVGVPAIVVLNALEYQAMARMFGHGVSLSDATELSIMASSANLLPVPGAAVVRARGLQRLGVRTGAAYSSALVAGLAWLGTTAVVASAVQLTRSPGTSLVFAAGGALALAASTTIALRVMALGQTFRMMMTLITIAVAAALAMGARYTFALRALGTDVSFADATAIAAAAPLGSLVGLLPGGLGARELIASLLAPAVGVPAAAGLLAASVDRFVSLGVMAVVASFLVRRRGRSEHAA